MFGVFLFPPAMWKTWIRSLGWEDPLEKGTATHSSILAWRIPWTVYSPCGLKVSDTTERVSLLLFELTCDFNKQKILLELLQLFSIILLGDIKNDETPMNRNDP